MAERIQSVEEVKRHFGGLKSEVLSELFELPAEVAQVDISMDASVRARLGKNTEDKVRRGAQEQEALQRLRAARQRYIDLELEESATIAALAEHANEILSPSEASVESVLQAATMTPDQIVAASEIARNMGDAGEQTLLVLFRACLERDLAVEQAHIAAMNEEWEAALNVLAETADHPDDLDPDEIGERFDSLVPQSATQILGSAQSEANISGMLRG